MPAVECGSCATWSSAVRLDGKIALVSGAARGIGEAIARKFVAEGAFVLVTDIDEARAADIARSLAPNGGAARLDVREETDWIDVTDAALASHGRIDIVVNNAGITGLETGAAPQDPEHASLADWRAVHATNSDGVFLGCKYAIRAMRRTGAGSIINMSSRAAMVGTPRAAAYAASKAVVRNHTKSVALYCAAQGLNIRCNSIHPGAILTPMWEPLLGSGLGRQARMAMLVRETPLRRFGTPDEVAALCVLLASDEAHYMTGAELSIDGGLLAGSAAGPR